MMVGQTLSPHRPGHPYFPALGRIASAISGITHRISELGHSFLSNIQRAFGCSLVGRTQVIERTPAPIAPEIIPVPIAAEEEESLPSRIDQLNGAIAHVISDNCNILLQLVGLTKDPVSFNASEEFVKNLRFSHKNNLYAPVQYRRKLTEIGNGLQSLCHSLKSTSPQVLKLIEELQDNQYKLAIFIKELS